MITEKELIKSIQEKTGVSNKEAKKVFNGIFDEIKEELKDDGEVRITKFGTFYVRTRKAREGYDPARGRKEMVGESKTPAYRPDTKSGDSDSLAYRPAASTKIEFRRKMMQDEGLIAMG